MLDLFPLPIFMYGLVRWQIPGMVNELFLQYGCSNTCYILIRYYYYYYFQCSNCSIYFRPLGVSSGGLLGPFDILFSGTTKTMHKEKDKICAMHTQRNTSYPPKTIHKECFFKKIKTTVLE